MSAAPVLDDFALVKVLGKGSYGKVMLVKHNTTGEVYAMKMLRKENVIKRNQVEHTKTERSVLEAVSHPFIVILFYAFQTPKKLYMVMEFCNGGELFYHLSRAGRFSEGRTRFYAAETTSAIAYLHSLRIIYRDLKPENLLLTEKGHIKLTDMGLAKFVIGKTYTTCGTPDYFAPELIASTGHTNAVDWWALGILTFELMSGHPPFESAFPMQIYSKVTKGISKIPFPPKCQGIVGDLIKNLLKNEPSERLPMRLGGVNTLKSHKWFEGFDWDAMFAFTLAAPYKPVVKSKKDLANFSARKEDMPKQLEYHDPCTGWDTDFASA